MAIGQAGVPEDGPLHVVLRPALSLALAQAKAVEDLAAVDLTLLSKHIAALEPITTDGYVKLYHISEKQKMRFIWA